MKMQIWGKICLICHVYGIIICFRIIKWCIIKKNCGFVWRLVVILDFEAKSKMIVTSLSP